MTDPRVERGMAAQLALRRQRLDAGDESLGWKVGFGTPAAMEKLGTDAPLVGFLLGSGSLAPGATVSLAGWTNPHLEPEVAIRMGSDLPGGADEAAAAAAIGAIGPAFELADIDFALDQVEKILAADVFQRNVVLGPRRDGATLDGTSARITHGGETREVDDPEAPTGPLVGIVRHVADVLAAAGERLRAGEIVIAGALVPPIPIAPGDAVDYELRPLGAVSVRFSA